MNTNHSYYKLQPDRRSLLAVLALHVAGGWVLTRLGVVPDPLRDVPLYISWVQTPAPRHPLPVVAAPAPPPAVSLPQVLALPVPAVVPPDVLQVPATAAPAPLEPAPAPVQAVASPAAAAVTVVPAPPPAAPPPAPRLIPSSAVQFIEPPVLVYPRQSRRSSEAGLVVVRAYVDSAGGAPRQVLVHQSSGFPRLDEAALLAVQKARFKPHTDNGQPVEGWALIPINFELEK